MLMLESEFLFKEMTNPFKSLRELQTTCNWKVYISNPQLLSQCFHKEMNFHLLAKSQEKKSRQVQGLAHFISSWCQSCKVVNFVPLNQRISMKRSSKDSIDSSKAKFGGGYNVGNIFFLEPSKRKSNHLRLGSCCCHHLFAYAECRVQRTYLLGIGQCQILAMATSYNMFSRMF